MTVAEAAENLGVTEQHVRRLIREGVISAERVGRGWRIVKMPKEFSRGSQRRKRPMKPRAERQAKLGITTNSTVAREMAHWAERFFGDKSEIDWLGPIRDGVWRVRNRAVPRDKWPELYRMAHRFVAEAGKLNPPEDE